MKVLDPKDLIIHVNECPPPSKAGDVVSVDTEFFHMQENRLHRPHGLFAGLGCSYDGEEVWIITDETLIPEFMSQIEPALHVFHNSKFDIGQIRRYCDYPDRKLLWDTMIMEQVMYAGWYSAGEFSLADLSRRHLDLYMDKSVREQFEDYEADTMSREQLEYLAVDVVTTWLVQQEQAKKVDENDLNVWYNIDRCAVYSLLKTKGMMLDVDKWKKLAEYNRSESERIQAKYGKTEQVEKVSRGKTSLVDKFTGINLGSWQQVAKELSNQGFPVDSTNEKSLNTITNECEFARDVLEYRGRTKAAGTYGEKWVDEFVEADGRIYSNFYVNGAATGRLSSSEPNVENIPVRDGNQFRECFIAQPGYVLVDADFSAQEPRVWSYISGDEDMQQIFRDKKDIYIYFAKEGFGWDLDKKDPRRSKRMKPTVLGAIFGLTKYGLLQKDQIPLDEGEELLNAFWKVFKRSKEYKDEIQQTRDYVQTVYGRKYWLNVYQFGYQNNALNSPVQGTAADITKISGYKFQMEVELEVERAGYSEYVFIINYIHDEILVECREDLKDWTMEMLKKVMVKVAEKTHDGVPADVEVNWGYDWASSHS
jgi:DNA polymerase-1